MWVLFADDSDVTQFRAWNYRIVPRFAFAGITLATVFAFPAAKAFAPPVPTYPSPTIAPPLPAHKLDDGGLPPISVDDPFNENDLSRTAANLLTPEQIQAMLNNEESVFWTSARREINAGIGRTRKPMILARSTRQYRAGKKLVALTFDDGPHTATTQPILDILKRRHVPATFFFVGAMAARHPELVRAAAHDGHSIGNHTFHHVTMPALSQADAATEIKACGSVIKAATGAMPHLFRPPGGQYTPQIAGDAAALGYQTVLWTCDPGDYLRLPPAVIAKRTLKTVTPGGIIILHSGVGETVRALPSIIESLRAAGYLFVTVDEMLKTPLAGKTKNRD